MKTKYIIIGKRGNLAKAIMKVLEASHGTNSFIGLSSEEVISYLKQKNSYISAKNDYYLEFIWCSGTSKARSSKENCEIDFFSFNGFIEVIRKMKINNCRITFISSGGTVYGNNAGIVNENSDVNPESYYAKMKVDCENSLNHLQREDGVGVAILRLANIYGGFTHQRSNGVVGALIAGAKDGLEFKLSVALCSTKQYGGYRDYSSTIIDFLSKSIDNFGYGLKQNIYSTHQYSVTDLAEKVKLYFNKEIDLEGNLDLPEETVILNSVKSAISAETKWNSLENYLISSYPKTP